MKKPNEDICILLIACKPSEVQDFRDALSGLDIKVKLTAVTTLKSGLHNISKRIYDIIFCHYMAIDNGRAEFLQGARKINTRTAIIIITDAQTTVEQKNNIKGTNVHRIDQSLITSEGLDYVTMIAVRHTNLRRRVNILEEHITPMMENLSMFIFYIDRDGIIRYANGQSLKLLELSQHTYFVNRSIYEVAKNHPDFIAHVERAMLGKEITGIDLLIKDIIFDVSCIPAIDKQGDVEGVYGIARDFTKRASDQKSLLKAKQEIERNALLKEQFSANISHEIRTPLNAIVGFSDLLVKEQLTKDQLLYANAIKQSSENLLVIVNGILDFSKASAKKLKLNKAPFDLRETINILEATIMFQLHAKNLFLVIDIDDRVPEYIVGDSVRVSQVLLNLLSNAVKFTEKGGICLSVFVKKTTLTKTVLLFRVRDTGIGIPQNELKNIFKRFAQVQTENKYLKQQDGGTGLGLPICKYLTNLQKGLIDVESALGRGSTFFVELPFGCHHTSVGSRAPQQNHVAQSAELMKGKNALLVEDNSMNKLLTEIHLKSWGMRVDTVSNGQLAVEKTQTKTYDIIFMDIQMPVMNGLDATRSIRLIHSKDELPIVAMTAHALPSEQKKCKVAGMNDYIVKPYKVEAVKNLVINLLTTQKNAYTNAF